MTKVIYMRLDEKLHKRLEAIVAELPGDKSTIARFLLGKAIDEYERRKATGDQLWFPAATSAVVEM